MNLDVKDDGDGMIVTVEEARIDAFAAVQFRDAVRQVTADRAGPVVLDLRHVMFLDSSGLGAVVSLWKSLGQDRPLELAEVQEPVARVFRLTRLDEVLTIHVACEKTADHTVHAG